MANPNVDIKDIIKSEYLKCASDAVHFMKRYCFIQHPTRGKILFNLYQFQEQTLRDLMMYDYNLILKSRQLGISTLVAGYSLWLCMFNNDKNVLVIATKQDVAKNLVTKVREMYANLPVWLKKQTVTNENNKLSMRFVNGSQIKAVASSPDAGRSEALSLLIMDEAAFITDINEIWTSAQQTLATGGKCIALSTPNGVGNWFHKQWQAAEAKKNKFHTIRLKWDVHPERDQTWRNSQDELLGPHQAAQECDTDFLSSGNSVIEMSTLGFYEKTFIKDPIEMRGFDRNYWIWEYPDYTKQYIVAADVARGDGSDYSAFHVIDIVNLVQVAEYSGQLGTKEYGNLLVGVGTEYNNALLVVENASIGWAAIQQIIDRQYQNLFYSYKDLKVVDVQAYLNKGYDLKNKEDMVPGFTTSGTTRPLIISKMEMIFRERGCIIQSKRLLDELMVFIWKNSRPEAQHGYNDDLVMSWAIGLWVRDTALFLRQQGIDLNKKALGLLNSSTNYYGVVSGNNIGTNPYQMKHDKGLEDISWLLK